MTHSADLPGAPAPDNLLEIATRLNAATGMAELLALLADPTQTASPAWAALYQVIETDDQGNPAWGEVSEVWARDNKPSPLPVGMRFFAAQFPFTALWVKTPDALLLIDDVLNNDQIDKNSQTSLSHSRSRALAVIPITRGQSWVGFATISWDKPHPYNMEETLAYQAVATLAAPLVENLRLRRLQQQRLDTTLFDISRRLSTAQNEDELLRILTQPSLESGVAVSLLAYIDNDAKDQPLWAEFAATWQQENSRATADLIAAIWAQIVAHSQQAGQPLVSTGSRYALSEFPFTSLWLAGTSEPQLIANAAADHRLSTAAKQVLEQAKLQAMAVIPLALGDQWVGVITMLWAKPHAFTETEISTYRAFTTLASPAVAARRRLNAATSTATVQTETAYRFRALAEYSAEPLAICDQAGEIQFANDPFAELLRFSGVPPVGKHLATLLPEAAGTDEPPFPAAVTDTVQGLLAGWQGQRPLRRNDGRVIPADIATFPLTETGDVVVTIHDRTEAEQVAAWPAIQRRLQAALAATDDHQAGLQACLTAASEASGLERARLYQVGPDSAVPQLLAHHGFTPEQLASMHAPGPGEERGDDEAPTTGAAITAPGLADILTQPEPQFHGPPGLAEEPARLAGDTGLTAAAIVPVYDGEQLVAVMHLASQTQETMPAFAPVPLQTIAGYIAAQYRQQQARQALTATGEQATINLNKLQAGTEAALLATQTALRQDADETQQQLTAALDANRLQAETHLQETRAHAAETLGQLRDAAQNQLRATDEQANSLLGATRDQATADLQILQNRLDTALQQNSNRLQSDIETVRAEAGVALATMQQTHRRLEGELEVTRNQARADLEAAQSQAHAQLETTRSEAKATLEATQSQAHAQLEAARSEAKAALEATQSQAHAQLEATQTQSQTSFEAFQAQTSSALEQAQSRTQSELAMVKTGAVTALQLTRQQTTARLAAVQAETRDHSAAMQGRLQTELEEQRNQLSDQFGQTTSRLQTELASTRQEAETALNQLRQTNQQLHADLTATRRQAQADLDTTQAQARSELESARHQADAEITALRQEAEHALQQLSLSNEQLHTDLQAARRQAQADLEASQSAAQAQLEAIRNLADAEIAGLRQQNEQALDAERERASAELEAERHQSAAAIAAATAAATAQLEDTRRQARAELEATQAESGLQLVSVKTQAEAALVAARREAETSLRTTSQNTLSRLDALQQQTTAALNSVAARQAQLVNALAEWVCRIDTEGRVVSSNGMVEPLLGYTPAEIDGVSLFSLVHPEQQQDIQNRFVQALVRQSTDDAGGWSNLTLTWVARDGSTRYTRNTLTPDFNEQGYLTGFYNTNLDLTPLHLARQENRGLARQIRAVTELSTQISNAKTPENLLELFVSAVQSRLEFDHVQIYVFDTASQTLILRAPEPTQSAPPLPLDQTAGLVTNAARSVKTVVSNDVTRQPDFTPDPQWPQTKAQLAMPLLIGNQLWGVLDIHHNRTNRFSQADIDLLNTLVGQLNFVAANLELQKQQKQVLQEQATLKQRIVEVQKETVQTLPTPVIPLMGQMIAVPLIGKLDGVRVNNIIHALGQGHRRHRARAVMLDVSGVPALDSAAIEHLNKIIDSAKGQGMQTMVSGLPEELADQVNS
jgi:PAS domain S-box-containing protein